jgi:tetratricopeptide (TPR) repeat protein
MKDGKAGLIGGTSIVALMGIGALLFVLLFRGSDWWRAHVVASARSAVSVAYLRALVVFHPADAGLRINLAQELAGKQEWDKAYEALQPMLGSSAEDKWPAWQAWLTIKKAEVFTDPVGDPGRQRAVAELTDAVDALARGKSAPAYLQELAKLALEFGRVEAAARSYERLGEQGGPEASRWLGLAGKWYLAEGRPDLAAHAYHEAALRASEPQASEEWALRELQTLVAGGLGARALKSAGDCVARFPQSPAVLEEAVAIARGESASQKAFEWGRRQLELEPDNRLVIERQLAVALEGGLLKQASGLAEKLVALKPTNAAYRKRAAEVAEWAGEPGRALSHWRWLASREPSGPATGRSLELARGLGDEPARIELLRLVAARRALRNDEIDELAYSVTRANMLATGTRFLRDYLRRYPGHLRARKSLADLQARQGDLVAAAETWLASPSDSPDSVVARTRASSLLWRAGQRARAFELLDQVKPRPGSQAADYWLLYGDEAWELKRKDKALIAYRVLWDGGSPSSLAAERLIILTSARGSLSETISLSEAAFRKFRQPRLLLLGTDAAIRAGQYDKLDRLLKLAATEKSLFDRSATYWLQIGMLASRQGQGGEARRAYERALQIDPKSDAARASLLWLAIDGNDDKELSHLLVRWKALAEAEPGLWQPYAVGFTKLGMYKQALPWYQRRLRVVPKDSGLMTSYADSLLKMGRGRQADRLRRLTLYTLLQENPAHK